MDSKYLTIADVNNDGNGAYYKFVLVGDEFRFVKISDFGVGSHLDIVDESEYPQIQAAGGICTFGDSENGYWRPEDGYSSKLLTKIGDRAVFNGKALAKLQGLITRKLKD